MSDQTRPLLIQGAPGSPYTRKMLAVLRYKHIPYRYINRGQAQRANLPRPKVELLPTFYFPQPDGTYQSAVDSTPLIRRLESEYPGRPIVPPTPALAFFDALIEDYADEWLTKAMFHYRWHHAQDRAKAGTILPLHQAITAPWGQAQSMAQLFTNRQVGRLRYVGSNDVTAPVIEASYRRFLGIFDAFLSHQPFLFGDRPAAADFAIFGQLTQLTHFDPTSSAVALQSAPRTYAWVDVLEDLSGLPDDVAWCDAATTFPLLVPLLTEIGRVHVPMLLANEHAIAIGATQVQTEIDGLQWEQTPFPYHVKCLAELRRLHAALPPTDRAQIDACLGATRIDSLFAKLN